MNDQMLGEWKRLYEEAELSSNEIARRYNVTSRKVDKAIHKLVQVIYNRASWYCVFLCGYGKSRECLGNSNSL